MPAIYGNQPIENPAAYERAIKRNILENARKTFERTYPDHEDILSFVADGRIVGVRGTSYKEGFVGSLAHAFDTFGKLTTGQVNAVRKCIIARAERIAARKAEWADKNAALNAERKHLGAVGDKVTLTLTIAHIIILDGAYGSTYIYILEDAEQNVVIYKGNSPVVGWTPEGTVRVKGDTFTITATVKEHGVREGVKQTVIQRPKALKTA
jgi:hypothetical protein